MDFKIQKNEPYEKKKYEKSKKIKMKKIIVENKLELIHVKKMQLHRDATKTTTRATQYW